MVELAERTGAAPRFVAVVRRGETEVYRLLKGYLERRGLVEVIWDRRLAERRQAIPPSGLPPGGERRRADRRSPAPARAGAYRLLGFFLARR
jgi:hypothetical protein